MTAVNKRDVPIKMERFITGNQARMLIILFSAHIWTGGFSWWEQSVEGRGLTRAQTNKGQNAPPIVNQ